ncbi:MAG: signal peptidase I, partial [Pseudomonadota bacterium]
MSETGWMARAAAKKKESTWDTIKTVFWALVIAMAFRSILFQPFSIPSGSMKPTLLVGDYLFVSKFSYGYSKYSLPFSPDIFDGRILGSLPERGDVVVFKHPRQDACTEDPVEFGIRFVSNLGAIVGVTRYDPGPNDCTDYIKRVIGLPGDEVQMIDGIVHINGQRVGMTRTDNFVEPKNTQGDRRRVTGCLNEPISLGGPCEFEHWIEELPGGRKHSVLNLGDQRSDNTPAFKVQPGHILFLG